MNKPGHSSHGYYGHKASVHNDKASFGDRIAPRHITPLPAIPICIPLKVGGCFIEPRKIQRFSPALIYPSS